MLREIICDKFKEKKIEFYDGLNVVLGDEQGSNSIGKSTFLMIIDYVYGGKDYVMKSIDIQRNVGAHIIKFSFVFKGNKYYFSRNTSDTEYVNICNDKYEVTETITLEQYTNKLKSLYEFGDKDISFRDVVGRYIRVYGKDNLNEKHPLDVVGNEKPTQAMNALLKLYDLYAAISELEDLAKRKGDELSAFKNAQKYHIISKIGARQRKANDKQIAELEEEREKITDELNNSILDINSEKTDAILELKREISDYNKKIRAQRTKLIPLQENISGSRIISKDDLSMLKKFFPEIEIKRLEEIQNFHKEISAVLKEEIKEEISSVQNVIQLLEGNKAQVEQKVKEISEISNLSQVILFKFAELQKKIEILSNQNKYYDELQVLSEEKKDADSRKQMMRMQQLSQLQNWINIKLQQLNDEIYHATKRPPIIMFDNKQYKFETIDDTGTGTCYRGMVLFDLAVLQDTCLPILVHDSVLLKQIEDVAIEKILDMYKDSKKQIFISLDKATSYSKKSQQILFDKKVLCLGPNGRELFGQSWSRK